jgi:hypothetical protein
VVAATEPIGTHGERTGSVGHASRARETLSAPSQRSGAYADLREGFDYLAVDATGMPSTDIGSSVQRRSARAIRAEPTVGLKGRAP